MILKQLIILTYVLALQFTLMSEAATPNKVYFENFENGSGKWTSLRGKKLNFIKVPGKNNTVLNVFASDTVASPIIKLKPATRYILSLDFKVQKRGLFLLIIQDYDKKGKLLTVPKMERIHGHQWRSDVRNGKSIPRMEIPFDSSINGGNIRVVIRKWMPTKYYCQFDNFKIEEINHRELLPKAPIPLAKNGIYTQKSLMLPGPDKVLYPNFTNAGIQEWKSVDATFEVNNFGAIADDGKNDSDAFEKACNAAIKAKGGTIKLAPGTYRLTRKLLINSDKILIKGAGRDKTKIVFNLPDSKVFISTIAIGPIIRPRVPLNIYFYWKNVKKVRLSIAGKIISSWNDYKKFKSPSQVRTFRKVSVPGEKLVSAVGTGRKVLEVELTYNNGSKSVTKQPFILSKQGIYSSDSNAIITFNAGYSGGSSKILLKKDLLRGDREVLLANASKFRAGSYIYLAAPETKRWNKLALNSCKWGNFRRIVMRVEKVIGNKVILTQPVSIDFPIIDKAYAVLFKSIKFCGVEDFTIEQEGEIQKVLKISTILFRNAVNCRAKNVKVINSGYRPIYASFAKNCQISDCVFDGAWSPKGTLAYAGFDYAWDCLIERLKTSGMRHGPILNWTCSGNVIRDSVFNESDAQLHAGWCHDNLFEQCKIKSTTQKNSGYGYGFFATSFNDSGHGPNGPRNVIYNCDSVSMLASVFMGGGGTSNWLLMYNRFKANSGPGIIQRFGSRDNRIEGNIFMLKDSKSPMLYYESVDNTGDIVKNNTIYGGNGRLFQGSGKPQKAKDNHFLPFKQNIPKPIPPTPSIYKWQLKNYPKVKRTGIK